MLPTRQSFACASRRFCGVSSHIHQPALSRIIFQRPLHIPKKSVPPSQIPKSSKEVHKSSLRVDDIPKRSSEDVLSERELFYENISEGEIAKEFHTASSGPSSISAPDAETPDISKIVKPIPPNDSFVSCSIFDISGNVVAVSRKFPKTKFLSENGLYPRDLRKIDSSAIDIIPTIAVRGNCILVNLLHIKAIVKSDIVMIFDTAAVSNAQRLSLFMYDLESKLKLPNSQANTGTYEFRAVESILINVMTCLETELQLHLNACGSILEELEDQINREKLRELLIKSKALTAFYQKALLIRNVLDELLENDEDLAQMYLTERLKNPEYERDDYAEIEMILESYYKQCDEFVQSAESLINDIKSTEEIVNIILDANRNSLMLFELKITVYTLGFTVATALPAFFGMNLKNYIEDSNLGFVAVVGFSTLLAFLVTWVNFNKLESVQRITMMLPGAKSRNGPSKDMKALAKHEALRTKAIANRANHIYSGVGKKNELILSKRRSWMRGMFVNRKKNLNDPKHRDVIWKWLIDGKK